MSTALARAFRCPRSKNGKHMMRLVRPVTKWHTYRCSKCGYSFNPEPLG